MANEGHAEPWNGEEAGHWVTHRLRYDTMLAPFGDGLLAAAQVAASDRVLDVGCGCGTTTLEAGRRAAAGTATGLDLSTDMLEVARLRAAEEGLGTVAFVVGDAQTFAFPADGYDVAISRFGVMFFKGGMGRAVLAGADEAARDRAVAAVRDALAPFVTAEGVRIGAGAWLVTARRQ